MGPSIRLIGIWLLYGCIEFVVGYVVGYGGTQAIRLLWLTVTGGN